MNPKTYWSFVDLMKKFGVKASKALSLPAKVLLYLIR